MCFFFSKRKHGSSLGCDLADRFHLLKASPWAMLGVHLSWLIGSEIWRAPVDMVKISPLFTGFYTCQVLQDFWTINSIFWCPKSITEHPFSLEKYEAPRISEEGPLKFLPPQQSSTQKKMSRLDVGQLMVDNCNSMIHQPFSGTGFQSLPKVTNPEEVRNDPKNNSQENLLGKLKKGVWTSGCIWKPMQNYPNDSSLLGHLQKQLTKNSHSINRPEKVGDGLPFPTFLDTTSSKTVTATTSKRYSWNS